MKNKNIFRDTKLAEKTIKKLEDSIAECEEHIRKKANAELSIIDKHISSLESKRREIISWREQKMEQLSAKKNKQIETISVPIIKLNHILRLIHLSRSMKSFEPEYEIRGNADGIAIIRKTPFTVIRAYIVENRRPKNKYQIEVIGRTIFTGERDLDEPLPRTYYSEARTSGDNICLMLASAPTKDELINKWNNKLSATLVNSSWLKAIVKSEAELQEVIDGKYNDAKWQYVYLLSQKSYYENNYSHGTETPEYKAIIKEIAKIRGKYD